MSKEAMKLALGKIKSARDCHFAAIDTLLFEAEEILEEALAEQPAQQEPVAWVEGVEIYWHNAPDLNDWIRQNGQPLYTSPPARKPLTDDTCKWARPDSDHMPDTWEASCGAMWTFTEGGPKDNDMHFCPNCGKPAIEAARGIKENT